MIDIIISIALATPLLIIMIYPAMKVADWLSQRYEINQALDDKLTVIFTIIFSIIGGLLLHFV